MSKLSAAALAALSLEPDAGEQEHPRYTRAKWEEWKKEEYYTPKHVYNTDYAAWLKSYHGVEIPGPRDHFTTRQVESIARLVAEELRTTKGYDEVDGGWEFAMNENGYDLRVNAGDSWQDNLPYEYKSHDGAFTCTFRKVDEIWDALRAVPRRDRRELEVLLRQTNNFSEMAKGLRSKAARAFAEELLELSSKHQNLLSDLR